MLVPVICLIMMNAKLTYSFESVSNYLRNTSFEGITDIQLSVNGWASIRFCNGPDADCRITVRGFANIVNFLEAYASIGSLSYACYMGE